jgi:hypothetical protein
MFKIIKVIGVCIVFATLGCTKGTVSLEGFDVQAWQNDKGGCKGDRVALVDQVEVVKNQLLGMKSEEVAELLGTPDKNELYKRNQKFFVYHIDPAPTCTTHRAENTRTLQLRFNATEKVNEVMVYF